MTGKVIYNLLSNSSELSSLIGDKIYPSVSQDETKTNYIVYQKNSTAPTNTKCGRSTLDIQKYNILIFANTEDLCNQIALGVRNALDHFEGVNSGLTIDKILFEGEDSDFDTSAQIYFKAVDYEVRFKNIYSSLARPTGFSLSYTGSNEMNLTWTDNATGETGYKVYRSDDLQNFTAIATIAANSVSYDDTTVVSKQIYYYYIVAYDSNGNGYASEVKAQRAN